MIRVLFFLLALTGAANAQSVQQSGTVTPGHGVQWVTNGVIKDSGGPPSGSAAITIGTTQITSGINKGLLFNNNGVVGNLATLANGILTTDSSGTPSITALGAYLNLVAVANNTALKASCTNASGCPANDLIFASGVWRLTFGNGNGAEPLWYNPSNTACSLNAGLGDDGLQVKSADGKCWIAAFPAGGGSVLQYGAIGDGNATCSTGCTDNTSAIQAAVNNLPSNGFRIVIPNGDFCVSAGMLTIPASPTQGFAPSIVGYSAQSSILDDCNHDINVLTSEASFMTISNLLIYGRGARSTDTFTITKAALYIHGGGNIRLSNVSIQGGANTIFSDNSATSITLDNVQMYNAYGGANVLLRSTSWFNCIHCQLDQQWPGTVDTSANKTYAAWASGQNYAANTVVSTAGYYIQCMNCDGVKTTSGSAPTLKPYGATINNGSDTVNWQLLAPTTYVGLNCDTGCNVVEIANSDIAGPYSANLAMNNSLSGVAPNGVSVIDSTFSFSIGGNVTLNAGSNFEMKGGSISSCAASGCWGVEAANLWVGPANVVGVYFTGSFGYGAINAAGAQFTLTNSTFSGSYGFYGFLAESGAAQFVVSNNIFVNAAGIVTIASGTGDYYTITGNTLNGGTVVDSQASTHRTIDNPGVPRAVAFGGTGAATLTGIVVGSGTGALAATQVTGAVKDNGSGTLTQAACTDLSNGTALCSATVGQIPGTSTNDSATAGNVGEYVVSGASSRNNVGTALTNVTISIASPGVVTWTGNPYFQTAATGHGCASAVMFGGTPPTGLNTSTTYYVTCDGTFTANAFHVSDTAAHAIAGTNTINTTGSDGGSTATNNVTLSTGTAQDYGALSLTAGDWDVTALILFTPGATTSVTFSSHGITSSSALAGTLYASTAQRQAAEVPTDFYSFGSGTERVSLSGTTTLFCGAFANFTVSTMKASGECRARRVR